MTYIPVDDIDKLLTLSVTDMCAQNSTQRRMSAFDFHRQAWSRRHWQQHPLAISPPRKTTTEKRSIDEEPYKMK